MRSITHPLEQLRHTIVKVATSNDFTERASAQGKDEIAQTAEAFNQLLEDVQDSLREVLGNAESIAEASGQSLRRLATGCPIVGKPERSRKFDGRCR